MPLDISGLTPLDTTGLQPMEAAPKFDTSKLQALDVSGLEPVEDDPSLLATVGQNLGNLYYTGAKGLERGMIRGERGVIGARVRGLMDAEEQARVRQADEANPTLRDVPVQQNLPATLDMGSYAEADRRRLAQAKPYDTTVEGRDPEEYAARKRANLADLAIGEAKIRKLPAPKIVDEFFKPDNTIADAWQVFKKAPATIIVNIGMESLPASLPSAAAYAAGSVVGGRAGGMALGGAVSAGTDYALTFLDAMSEEGVDFTDAASIEAAFKNKELMDRIEKRSMLHAGPVGVMDAVSMGIASKVLGPKGLIGHPVLRELANIFPQIGVQAATGMAGEAGGQLASGQPLNTPQILAEGLGEAVSAPVDVAAAAFARGERKPANDFERILRDFDTPGSAPAAAGGLPTPEGLIPVADVPPPPPAPVVSPQAGYEAMYGEQAAPAPVAAPQEPAAPPSALSTVIAEHAAREGNKPSPLGKGMAQIAAEQSGGQAAVNRAAGTTAGQAIPVGEPTKIVTPDSSAEIEARPVLVELDTLKLAEGKLQPRDRSRVEMVQEAKERAVRLDPSRLVPDRVSDAGAPIVSPDGTVISGNGRMLSIAEVYSNPALRAKAAEYKASLPAEAQGMSKPVLVMQSTLDGLDAVKFAQQSNRPRIATLSATEQAETDATVMGDMLGLYQGGDFESAGNAQFLKAFATNVVASSERNSFSKDGQLSAEGMRRMQGAILARAYGDSNLLSRMLESTDDNVRAIVGALQEAAPQMAALRKAVQSGQVMENMDPLADINAAVTLISDMRKRRLSPAKFFRQMDAFTEVNPDVAGWVLSLYNPADPKTNTEAGEHALSRSQMTAVFRAFANEAMQHKTGGFFEDETTRASILSAVGRNASERAALAEAPGAGQSDGSGGTQGGQAQAGSGGAKAALSDAQAPASAGTQQGEVTAEEAARFNALKRLKNGVPVQVPRATVLAVLENLKQDIAIVPAAARVGVVERIEPIKDQNAKVGEELVNVYIRLTDGGLTVRRYRRAFIRHAGAVWDEAAGTMLWFRLADGAGLLGKNGDAFGKSLRGELRHELLHLLKSGRVIARTEWDSLVRHARRLQVLRYSQSSFLRLTGKPVTPNTSGSTLETLYTDLYRKNGYTDKQIQENLDEEAVAHAIELAYHGELNAKDIAPFQSLIDKMELRMYGRGAQPVGAKAMASLAPTSDSSFDPSESGSERLLAALASTSSPSLDPDDAGPLRKAIDRFLEVGQDTQVRVRRLVERAGESLPDEADPYLAATLYYGRIGSRAEAADKKARDILAGAKAIATAANSPIENVKRLIDLYLIAKHAPERNAVHGDGSAGITNAEATRALATISNHPHGAEIIRVAGLVADMNRLTLQTLLDGRVISQETFDLLSTTYANHVPLNRILPEGDEEIGAVMAGGGFDVRGAGLQRARGSKLPIAPVLENVLLNHQQAVLRAEKNTVDLATLAFVRRFEDDLKGQITVLGGKKDERDIGPAERAVRDQITALKKMLPKDDRPHHMDRMPSKSINDPRVLALREDGEQVLIRFRDPALATAFKGTGRESVPFVIRILFGFFTKIESQLATRFNPDFALPNKIMDLEETTIYIAAQKELGAKGVANFMSRQLRLENERSIVQWLRGKDTPGARLYQELLDEGGTTGGLSLSTRDQIQDDLKGIEAMLASGPFNPKQGLKRVGRGIDTLNKIIEDSTRLQTYRMARARGLSKKRAAYHAKEASINFNRMGTAGPIVNAMFMFANASGQATVKMLRSMKNPKVASAVLLSVGTAVVAAGQWNDLWDEKWREKVTKWDRKNSLIVLYPSAREEGPLENGVDYFVIPVSWGLRPFLNLSNFAYDATQGVEWTWSDFAYDLTVSTIEAFNPLGGHSFWSAVTPTSLDMVSEIRSNESWSGSKIKPDPQRDVPEDARYFRSLSDKAVGQAAISGTEMLANRTGIAVSPADVTYAFEQLVGGAGRFGGRVLSAGSAVIQGKPIAWDEFPIVARFYRHREADEITGKNELGPETREARRIVEQQGRERVKRKYKLEATFEEIKNLPNEQVRKRIVEEVKKDPAALDVFKGLLEAEAKGLTGLDRQINMLGVENGERARYYFDRMKEASPEERRSIIEDGIKKKLLSRGVIEQIQLLGNLDRLSPEKRKQVRDLAAERGLRLPPE